jgi:hypothetical protein
MDPAVFRPEQTIHFIGDSLMRQKFIAMSCLLESHITHQEVSWACTIDSTGKKRIEWPCHETKECVKCGEHSGFVRAKVDFANGAKMRFVSKADAKDPTHGIVKPWDTVLIEPGIHGESKQLADKIFKDGIGGHSLQSILSLNVTLVWVVSEQDAFKSPHNTGNYDPKYIGSHLGCARVVKPTRSTAEWGVLAGHPALLQGFHGVVDFEGLNEQGDVKIGGGVGTFGDCQHYCMPGLPDVYVSAIFTLLKQQATLGLRPA